MQALEDVCRHLGAVGWLLSVAANAADTTEDDTQHQQQRISKFATGLAAHEEHRHLAGGEALAARMTPALRETVAAKLANAPTQVGGLTVKDVNMTDGVKLIFDDQTWLLFRLSGTEPVARVSEPCRPAATRPWRACHSRRFAGHQRRRREPRLLLNAPRRG